MFARLVDEYRLTIAQREVDMYDALLRGGVRRVDDAIDILNRLDECTKRELERFWMHELREMSSYERERSLRLYDECCPCREFWEISTLGRLHDPRMVERYFNYQLMMLEKCDVGGLAQMYIEDLIVVYERAYREVLDLLTHPD